ncbi:MAG: hypothetical protein ABSF00_03530 [Candidatus Bathyarchaeia archaeon]|jgi:hypothetical protein
MSAWTTSAEVKIYAATKWSALNVSGTTGAGGVQAPFPNEAAFNTFIDNTLIPRAQSHINRFCKRDFDVDFPGAIPPAIQDIAARASSNMIQYMVTNKMGPLVHETMFQISIPLQAVLPKDLQDLLTPWIKRYPYTAVSKYQTPNIVDGWNEPTPDQ